MEMEKQMFGKQKFSGPRPQDTQPIFFAAVSGGSSILGRGPVSKFSQTVKEDVIRKMS